MNTTIDALVEALEPVATWMEQSANCSSGGPDHPPEPTSQFDYELLQAASEIRAALARARAEQAEPQPVASELAQTAPECIWLQVNPDAVADSGLPFPDEHDNVTWCDESIGGEEVKYVCADLATPPAPVQAVPEGWVCVPVEPTQEMMHAAIQLQVECADEWEDEPHHSEIYLAMIAAAPPLPGCQPNNGDSDGQASMSLKNEAQGAPPLPKG